MSSSSVPFFVLPRLKSSVKHLGQVKPPLSRFGPAFYILALTKLLNNVDCFRVHHARGSDTRRRMFVRLAVKVIRSVSPASHSWGGEVAGGFSGNKQATSSPSYSSPTPRAGWGRQRLCTGHHTPGGGWKGWKDLSGGNHHWCWEPSILGDLLDLIEMEHLCGSFLLEGQIWRVSEFSKKMILILIF